MSAIDLDVVPETPDWDALPAAEDLVQQAVVAAIAGAGEPVPEGAALCVLLTGDEEIRSLNRSWRGKDKATNVLSFPAAQAGPAAPPVLGDVAVAFGTLRREAEAEGKPLAHHLQHLVVHGVLHLLGHDHETAHEAERMEALERAILAGLGVPDPYAGTSLDEAGPEGRMSPEP